MAFQLSCAVTEQFPIPQSACTVACSVDIQDETEIEIGSKTRTILKNKEGDL